VIGHIRATHDNCERPTCLVCDLFICTICGCMEGSLLPVCPGRRVTAEEQDAYYTHYCAGTGPFARATFDMVDAARAQCYERCYPGLALRPSSKGALDLYDAVFELWLVTNRRKTTRRSA
jgi:hypothetical protein